MSGALKRQSDALFVMTDGPLIKSARAAATGHEGDAEQLHHYWTKGEGLAKWAESPHPFAALKAHLAQFIHDERELNATTAQWVHDGTGHWPVHSKSFDPGEVRDGNGRWSLIGVAEHLVVDADEPAKGNDRLKLAGKIPLAHDEHLVHSAEVPGHDGTVRLASVERGDGTRDLRIGIGGASGDAGDADAPEPWNGGRDDYDAMRARRPGEYLYEDRHTAKLEPEQAASLRSSLADLHKRSLAREKAAGNAADRADAAGGKHDQSLYGEAERIAAEPTGADGVIHSPWGDVHYSSELDDLGVGTEVHLAVVPPGHTLDDVRRQETAGVFTLAELSKLIRQLEAVSDAPA